MLAILSEKARLPRRHIVIPTEMTQWPVKKKSKMSSTSEVNRNKALQSQRAHSQTRSDTHSRHSAEDSFHQWLNFDPNFTAIGAVNLFENKEISTSMQVIRNSKFRASSRQSLHANRQLTSRIIETLPGGGKSEFRQIFHPLSLPKETPPASVLHVSSCLNAASECKASGCVDFNSSENSLEIHSASLGQLKPNSFARITRWTITNLLLKRVCVKVEADS